MTVTLKEKREMEKFIELLAFSTVKSFYPTAVLKYAQIDSLDAVFDFLVRCVEDGELKLIWEVKCTNDEMICARKILKVNQKETVLNKNVCCDICGKEFTVTNYDLFPSFEITQEFRELIREDLKKKDLFSDKIKLKEDLRELSKVVSEDNKIPSVSLGDLSAQTQLNIENVQHLQVILSGDGVMEPINKSIHVGGNISDNVNLNTGDNVTQINRISADDESVKAFTELLKDISEKAKDSNKAQLEFFVDKLKEAYEKNDKEEGSKLIGFLQSTLGNIGSLASVASLFGITLSL